MQVILQQQAIYLKGLGFNQKLCYSDSNMISRGFGKNKNIIARGFGTITILADIWRKVINFRLILSSRK